jgi:acyl-coenzyme A synthetase/AMP-(fatty) acid ligase
MSGYVGDIESTQKVLRNNKIYGSDLGYVDDNGMIHLTGRQGDVINIGGYKVDPTEVENVVMSYNSIKDCICISSEHPVIGTVLKLLVVLADDVQLDKRLLSSYLKSKLDPYKVPFYYDVVESIQRTYNGKLDRKYYKNN